MLRHTKDVMQNISDLTLQETHNFLSVARSSAHLTKKLISSEIVNINRDNIQKLEQYFFDQLEMHPQFAGIYLATPNGDFYYVSHNSSKVPEGYRTKIIRHNNSERETRLIWRDKEMNVILKETDSKDTYNPRIRPWYIKAATEKQIIWTDPYIFFTSKKPGITTAGPIYNTKGKINGIVGVDIQLDVLSKFIKKLRVGKTGLAFMINQNKDVIAFPDPGKLKHVNEKNPREIRLPKLNELENQICIKAFDSIRWEEKKDNKEPDQSIFGAFQFKNKKYYTMFTPVPESKISWMIGLYIPEEDYFGEIYTTQKQNRIFAMIMSIIATIAGIMMARSITRPIFELDQAAQNIANNDYKSLPKIKSGFIEIQRTAHTFEGMKEAVVNYKKELQHSQKMESIGTLAGGIAHDFNNLLFPILGNTEILKSILSEDDPAQENLDEIYDATLRASDLAKQILTFSRHESSEIKPIKIQPIIYEALKLIRSTIPSTIIIKQEIETDCPIVNADSTHIHQILMNLMTNSYHAMEKDHGGELKVSLKEIILSESDLTKPEMIKSNIKPGHYACLSIIDTGTGIDDEVIEKIFDPFFTTKEKGRGTGMGLSVVHGIVTNINGAIKVTSEPETGTQFSVYLPISKSTVEKTTTKTIKQIQTGTERILLVDDEEAIVKMEKQMLERLGYHVFSYSSSTEALKAFQKEPDKFDLVITDMAMPNMPGDILTAELLKISKDIPIIICTGFSYKISTEKAAAMGVKSFLLKPITMEDISEKIRQALDEEEST